MILSFLEAIQSTCYCFLDAGRSQETAGSGTVDTVTCYTTSSMSSSTSRSVPLIPSSLTGDTAGSDECRVCSVKHGVWRRRCAYSNPEASLLFAWRVVGRGNITSPLRVSAGPEKGAREGTLRALQSWHAQQGRGAKMDSSNKDIKDCLYMSMILPLQYNISFGFILPEFAYVHTQFWNCNHGIYNT